MGDEYAILLYENCLDGMKFLGEDCVLVVW